MKNRVVENMVRQQLNIGNEIDVVVLFTHADGDIWYFDISWYTEEYDLGKVHTYINEITVGLPTIRVKRERLD